MSRQLSLAAILLALWCPIIFAADTGLEERYAEAIRLNPTNPALYVRRANAWLFRGEFDEAIKDLTEAIRLDTTNAEYYARRGDVYARKGNADDAIKNYTQAITLTPHKRSHYRENLYHLRGNAWENKGEFENAIKDYTESIRLFPKYVHAYNQIAWLRATCANDSYRDGKKAVVDATKACELSEWQEGGFIDTLAAAYAEARDFSNAIKWQAKAIELTKTGREEMQKRSELYKAGKPYREEPKK